MTDNFYLVMYDVAADATRNKIAKLLQQHGFERIQYSVFCGPHHPANDAELWQRIIALVETGAASDDKVFVLAVAKEISEI